MISILAPAEDEEIIPSKPKKAKFSFMAKKPPKPAALSMETTLRAKIEREVSDFYNDPREDLQMIHKYKYLKPVFLKFNTPLCSSAPVERLFSFASIINAVRRGSLGKELFGKLVVLRANASKCFGKLTSLLGKK